jgi:uncharacterized glyoxalase superfamily protein PhnB
VRLRPSVIELVVSDMAASLRFFRLVGLDIPPEADTQPHVDVEIGEMRLSFDTEETIRSFDPGWSPAPGGQRVHLAFACESPAEVDRSWAELTRAGYEGHLPPWDAFWGMRYAVVNEPDGIAVDLFAPLAQPELPE